MKTKTKTKTKMKQKLAIMYSLLLAFVLVGCGSSSNPEIIMPDSPMTSVADVSTTAEEDAENKNETADAQEDTEKDDSKVESSGENYTVYLITMDLTDSYWQSIDSGCKEAVKELGNVTYKWIGPDTHDDALQSACIDEAVANGANAILLAANSADGVNDSLKKADEAGCKIVYVDCAANYDCVTALATDNEAAGKTAGETMLAELKEKGVTSGTIGIMGVTADTASCVAREEGFRSAFEGTDFTLADTVFMNDDAEIVKSAVKDGLSNNYVGFFGTNTNTSVAIGETIKEESGDVVVIGFDSSDDVLSLVSGGFIQATMQQNPSVMGHDGLCIAIDALEGKNTDSNTKTDTGVTVITKDSMQ